MDKVALVRCEEYNYDLVKDGLIKAVGHLGGFDKYIKKGDRVLLKINLLIKKDPSEAATTHPVFVRALADILLEYGASVVIGDSPGGPFTESALRGIYRGTGTESIAAQSNVTLNMNVKTSERQNPDGLLLKRLTVTDMLNDVDKVISVSKLKTHGMMTFTGAVKNMFGIIPGLKKAEYHMNLPTHDAFADALIDICLCAAPVLSFMDGIIGMEGHGPSAGNPRSVKTILASNSPYQLDKAAASIIKLDFSQVPTIKKSIERGLCGGTLDDIEFLGDNINGLVINDFDVPKTSLVMPELKFLPKSLKRFILRHLQPRPVFNFGTCVGCGDCALNCPAKVIKMVNKKPQVDLEGCIRCFCCQELCPKKAVSVYRPRILRILK